MDLAIQKYGGTGVAMHQIEGEATKASKLLEHTETTGRLWIRPTGANLSNNPKGRVSFSDLLIMV